MENARAAWMTQAEDGRSFLQRRVAAFGLVAAFLGAAFLVLRFALMGVDGVEIGLEAGLVPHALAVVVLLLVWLLCRGTPRSVRFVRWTEAAGLLLACMLYAWMGVSLPTVLMPHLIVVLAVGLGLTARAIYVPSTGAWTLLLTILAGIPVIVSTFFMYHQIDVEAWRHIDPYIEVLGASGITWRRIVFAAAWWSAFAVVCYGGSRVIYGLRAEVRDVRKLGQYTLTEKLGEGGMGIVYRATHAMLRRPTAVKLLVPDKVDGASLARFEREVQLTAALTHPNTVTIYDYGRTPDGVFYYAMEYLDGASLSDIVALDGPQPAGRVIRILRQAAGALDEAHGVGLIHRDVKPANIMLVEQGGKPDIVKLVDFGLVKQLARSGDALTDEDTVTGTPQYLAPEAIRSPDGLDGRSDLYALGAVGYYLLTGEHVFDGATVIDVCSQHLEAAPVPPSVRLGAPVPGDLEALVLACLAKDPDDRPRSARALEEALAACADARHWSEQDARAWWRTHREALAAQREQHALSGAGVPMDVALTERVGGVRSRHGGPDNSGG